MTLDFSPRTIIIGQTSRVSMRSCTCTVYRLFRRNFLFMAKNLPGLEI